MEEYSTSIYELKYRIKSKKSLSLLSEHKLEDGDW